MIEPTEGYSDQARKEANAAREELQRRLELEDADRLIEEVEDGVSLAWASRDWLRWWILSAALLGLRIGRHLIRRGWRFP